MYEFEGLLLNVLVLVFFLLFVPLFLGRQISTISSPHNKWIMTICASLGIITCISFPIDFSDGFFYDLRFVATIVGGLYGGVPGTIILWVVTNTFRILFGGSGIYSTLVVSSCIVVITLFLLPIFHKTTIRNKLMISGIFSSVVCLIVFAYTITVFKLPFVPSVDILFFVLQLCTTIGIIYVLEIIRETVFINKRMLKAEKMEVVSHLASAISHEVRNPLAVVRGFLQMMDQNNLSYEKRKEFLTLTMSEIDRANDIINHYLTFAKPSPENVEILNIKQEINCVIDMITPLANMNCVEIETKIDAHYVQGESQLLQQCLLNIAKNCIEAMPEHGKLVIESKVVHQKLIIQFSDSGQVMTEEQLSRIGEPYYTTKGREGTGLGMMAAIQIIKMMNGKLSITSKVDEGTKFFISFPLVDRSKAVN